MCSTVPIRVEAIGRVPPTPACGPLYMSLYPELVTIVARPNCRVGEIDDLADKRLDIGRPGIGRTRHLGSDRDGAQSWTRENLRLAAELKL